MLGKLSGLLALTALKTKDKAMIADNWQQSSRAVKWIANLLALRIFEDFEFKKLKQILVKIKEDSALLYWHLELDLQDKKESETLALASRLNHQSTDLLASFEKHYQTQNEVYEMNKLWDTNQDIHEEIERIKKELIKP